MNHGSQKLEDIGQNRSFTEVEQQLFLRMIKYFMRAENEEIQKLKLPGGNRDYIEDCEERLRILESIKSKVKSVLDF